MQSLSWQKQLAAAIKRPEQLLEYVGLDAGHMGYSKKGIEQFPVRVPHAFANRIVREDPDDPILRQVFPYPEEEQEQTGYVQDPLSEAQVQPRPGLLQKYQSRVLSITTGACAVHCRYCFRRHFPYQQASASIEHWQQSLAYINKDTSIKEVILSGGDPLSLSDRKLIELCQSLKRVKHVQRIRFHSRLPVVLPARLTQELVKKLADIGKSLVFVLHINHANEIDVNVIAAIRLLQRFNVLVLNQSVLLKGINDSTDTLIQLSEKLVDCQVAPYYLHLLDPVAGASHYHVREEKARQIIKEMRGQVSGYLVPKLVKEEIGAKAKTEIAIAG